MTEEERIIKAGRAREVTENPVYIEAFERLREGAITKLEGANLKRDSEEVYLYTQTLQIIKELRKYFDKTITDGRAAEVTLRQNQGFKRNTTI